MPEPAITIYEAREQNRCRICGETIEMKGGNPVGWKDEFREMLFPVHVVLNFGKEFAHGKCLGVEP